MAFKPIPVEGEQQALFDTAPGGLRRLFDIVTERHKTAETGPPSLLEQIEDFQELRRLESLPLRNQLELFE